jgi:DNA polymerase-1
VGHRLVHLLAGEPVIALIDGDILAYEKASAAEVRYDWNGDKDPAITLKKDPEDVFAEVGRTIDGIRRRLGATRAVVCLSDLDSKYWRKDIYPFYKAARVKTAKPLLLKDVKHHLLKHGAYVRPMLEADDVMGILATHPDLLPGKKVIVSADKDMKTIPGALYNPDKGQYREISEMEADYWHFWQTLTGDPTDGFPGCPRVGKQRAAAILDPIFESNTDEKCRAWEAIVAAYAKRGLNEHYALTQARLARICRHTDYDFEKKEVILWNPPLQ